MAGSPQHATLAAGVVTTLTFDTSFELIEVLNLDGGAEVYGLVDSGATDPAIGATGTFVLPAAVGFLELEPPTNKNTTVKLISSGTPRVSVRGIR